jgi:threonine dehydratase
LTVTDDQLCGQMRFLAESMKLIVEPTGCLAAAAVLQGTLDCRGKRVGIVLSGGNVDLAALAGFLA